MNKVNFKSGIVVYNEFNLNFHAPIHDQIDELQEDLLQVIYNNYVLDLGWYPALDVTGCFIIYIIKDSKWDYPIYQKEVPLKNLKKELQKAVGLVNSLMEKNEIVHPYKL